MKEVRLHIRFSEKEKQKLNELAAIFGMSVSEYVKSKLFDYNPDFLEEDKYICPHALKQAYFLAFSQIRIQRLLKEILLKQEGMTPDLFAAFRKEDVLKSEEILLGLGYRKVKKGSDE